MDDATYAALKYMLPSKTTSSLEFVTLGMFILDKIEYGPTKTETRPPVDNIIGGAGTYGVIGARLFSPSPCSKCVGWIVDAGYDFPESVLEELKSLDTDMRLRQDLGRPTTRGLNTYGPDDYRAFRYLTPKKRLEVQDLLDNGLLFSSSLHLICSPHRAQMICYELAGLELLGPKSGGLVIWEPVPDMCTPEYRMGMYETLRIVDVISPNHTELAGFFGITDPLDVEHPDVIQKLAAKLISAGIGLTFEGCAVIRAGRKGCLVCTSQNTPGTWLPAYYASTPIRKEKSAETEPEIKDYDEFDFSEEEEHENHPKVVDPTGGGNTFIGGFAVGYVRENRNALRAAAWGIVAASFAIEQIGIPKMEKAEDGGEVWNGVKVQERLEEYMKRCEELGICWEEEKGKRKS
ncbi:Double-stranded RNA-containing particles stability [Rhizina undulata]